MKEILLLAEWPNGGYDGAYDLDTHSCDTASSQPICSSFRKRLAPATDEQTSAIFTIQRHFART